MDRGTGGPQSMESQGQTQLSDCKRVHVRVHTHTHIHTSSNRYELPESDLMVFSYEIEKISGKKNFKSQNFKAT